MNLSEFNIDAKPSEVLEHLEQLAACCLPGGNRQRLIVAARELRDAMFGVRVSQTARLHRTIEGHGEGLKLLFSALVGQRWGLLELAANEMRLAAAEAARAAEQAAAEALAAQQSPPAKRAARASAEESPA